MAVAGYAVMRFAMVCLWLRAAQQDGPRRGTAVRYAIGITIVQLLWIARLWIHDGTLTTTTYFVFMACELAVPVWAERRRPTPYHPHHIAERYSLFTIIVLGEVVLAIVQAIQGVMEEGHFSADLDMLIVGALLIIFSIWWMYFKREHVDIVESSELPMLFGYGHLIIFAAVAGIGAALAAGVDVAQHVAHVQALPIAIALSVGVALYLLTLGIIHVVGGHEPMRELLPAVVVSVACLGIGFSPLPIGASTLLIGVVLALAAGHAVHSNLRRAQLAEPAVAH